MNRMTVERLKVFLEQTSDPHSLADPQPRGFMLIGACPTGPVTLQLTRAELVDLLEAAREAAPISLDGPTRCAKSVDANGGARCFLDRGHSGPCR